MFIETILGSKAKIKLLRTLSEVRTAYSLKDLVVETGLSLSITHKAAEELVEEKALVKIKGVRKERLYRFNAESCFAAALFDLFKTEKTRQRKEVILLKTWNILESMLTTIKEETDAIILFGSQARGEATLKSDIDILIIPRAKSSNLLQRVKEINKKISPQFITKEKFKVDIKNKTPLYNNIKREGVILFISKDAKEDMKEYLNNIKTIE